MIHYYPVLTIAGSDPSGGAGIQADIKTIASTGCYAMAAITAVTAQNTTGVRAVEGISPDMVAAQIDAVTEDIAPMATKTGMLFSAGIINSVADAIERHKLENVVVDPVMVATSGSRLLDDEAVTLIVERMMPLSAIITPNRAEAIALTGTDDTDKQIMWLRAHGAHDILLKGGDGDTSSPFSIDIFAQAGMEPMELKADRIDTRNTHGTGCTLSSAIASFLALGFPMIDAVKAAKSYITRALIAGRPMTVGAGHGPVNHGFAPRKYKTFAK